MALRPPLCLSSEPIRFEPVNQVTSVFYDEATSQLFAVRSGGAMGVVVKCPDPAKTASFRMVDKGAVISIKLSPSQHVLAVQRSPKSVEFVRFEGSPTGTEFCQGCRSPNSSLLDFFWLSDDEFVYVSDNTVEHYQLQLGRRQLKLLRSSSFSCSGAIFSWSFSCILVTSSSQLCQLQPFIFRAGAMKKLPKFDVTDSLVSTGYRVNSHDVTLCDLYGDLHVLVMCHASATPVTPTGVRSSGQRSSPSESHSHCVIYRLTSESTMEKVRTLDLMDTGRFAVSIIDSVIIVHHQQSKMSSLYDIRCEDSSRGDMLVPVCRSTSIAPIQLAYLPGGDHTSIECKLYSSSWVVFQPCTVIDAQLGCYWRLSLRLPSVPPLFFPTHQEKRPASEHTHPGSGDIHSGSPHVSLTQFLLLRRGAKPVLLQCLRTMLQISPSDTRSPPPTDSQLKDPQDSKQFSDDPEQVSSGPGQSSDDPDEGCSMLERKAVDRSTEIGSATTEHPTDPVTSGGQLEWCHVPTSLEDIGQMFDLINKQLMQHTQHELATQMSLPVSMLGSSASVPSTMVTATAFAVSQFDMLIEVLRPLAKRVARTAHEVNDMGKGQRFLCDVLMEYLRSLEQCGLSVEFEVYELLVQNLAASGRFYAIQQLLQYRLLRDSKPLAWLLLSLKGVYPPAEQMALDMLHRLPETEEQLLEILLDSAEISSALRFCRISGISARQPARRLLDPASSAVTASAAEKDDSPAAAVFYSVVKFFETRNCRVRGRPDFLPGERCDDSLAVYRTVFPDSA